MSSRSASLSIAVVLAIASGCNDTTVDSNAKVSIQDQCDPATFNASLGAGACTRQGTMTLAQFNSELSATQRVAAWQFTPAAFSMRVGQSITATNNGGETHTFTEVAQFGGGTVQALNDASGNSVEVPECKVLQASDFVAAGTTFTTDAETTVGTSHYQCCIHPWMRTTVTTTQ